MFSDLSQWTEVSGKYCVNAEEYSPGVETLTECQGQCLERAYCIGVHWSSYHAARKIEDPTRAGSQCRYCDDTVTATGGGLYDTYFMPGNPQQIIF